MRTLVFAGAAMVLASQADAQGVPMSYEQWAAGPPIAQDDIRVTWQGVTAWGYTVQFVNRTTGYHAVAWQTTPASPWQVKGDDGEVMTLPANWMGASAPVAGYQEPVYQPMPYPQQAYPMPAYPMPAPPPYPAPMYRAAPAAYPSACFGAFC